MAWPLTSKGIIHINSIDMVWLLNVKLTAEQSTYTYKAMAYWKLETGPQLILRLLRTIRCAFSQLMVRSLVRSIPCAFRSIWIWCGIPHCLR